MVVVNAGTREKDRAWIQAHLPSDVRFEDQSDTLAKIDVQGPNALAKVSSLLEPGCPHPGLARPEVRPAPGRESLARNAISALRYFRFTKAVFRGGDVIVSRTGYTGEKGVELYIDAAYIVALWEAFLKAGVKPAGLGARDTLRLEAGLPLYGHELSEEVTPVEAGMERYAAKAETFVGRDAIRQRLAAGPRVRLCGFRVAGRQSARAGNKVLAEGREIGYVTSGSFSPTLQYGIGLAYVETAWARLGSRLTVDTGRSKLDGECVAIPFYRAA
jgi:aminomethyltransferase